MSNDTSNKGRIYRIDQAWGAAYREKEERERNEAPASVPAVIEQPAAVPATVEPEAPAEVIEGAPTPAGVPVPVKFLSAALQVAARADVRFYLMGVFVHAVEGELRVVATDGHRMIISRFVPPSPLPSWTQAGVIIPRAELAQVLPLISRRENAREASDGLVYLDLDEQRKRLAVRSADGFCSFSLEPVEAAFPDYPKVIDRAAGNFARGEGTPLEAVGLDVRYVRAAADIGQRLGARAIHAFAPTSPDVAALFTFAGAPDSLYVVMPMRLDEPAVGEGVVRIIGESGAKASVAAFRAHLTRVTQALKGAKSNEERKRLEERRATLSAKVERLLEIVGGQAKRLTNEVA